MESSVKNEHNPARHGDISSYLRGVMAGEKPPAFPMVARRVLQMVQDSDVNFQRLCDVLSDDAALAARILAVSRSPIYGQRTAPRTLLDAVHVLGLRTLTSVVVASAAHSLRSKNSRLAEKLWNHSLAVGLMMWILSERVGGHEGEQAFLAGLLHDIGEMVLMDKDPYGFENLAREVKHSHGSIIAKEQQIYEYDHALIGVTMLNSWNLDSKIGVAVLNHHGSFSGDDINQLAALVSVAEHVCDQIGLGFVGESLTPAYELLKQCGCADAAGLEDTLAQLRRAYIEESAIFKLS